MLRSIPLVLLLVAAPARASSPSDFCKSPDAADWDKVKSDLGRASADFGMRLLRALPKGKDAVASPYSISTALSMVLVGARGPTAEELARGLARRGVPTGAQLKLEAALTRALACPVDGQTTKLYVADRLYLQKGTALAPDYVKAIRTTFDATVGEVDYKKNADGARKEINSWVESATQQKIKGLVPSGGLTPATRLVLVNAIFAKGRWKGTFNKADTKPGDFYPEPKKAVKTPMMTATGEPGEYNYAERSGYKAVELPFSDSQLSFLVLLPNREDGLGKLVSRMGGEELEDLMKAFARKKVELTLPKFKVESSFSLADALKALGIKRAFQAGQADFGGIDGGKEQLFIGSVLHKAFLDVNEHGVEAAAATAVMMSAGAAAPPPPTEKAVVFKADHPFLYAIVHRASGAILFLGTFSNPS